MRRSSPFLPILVALALVIFGSSPSARARSTEVPETCVIEDSGELPVLICDDEVVDLRRLQFERGLERLTEKGTAAVRGEGLYNKYLAKIAPSQQDSVADLSALLEVLAADHPELYAAFVVDASAAVQKLQAQIARETAVLLEVHQRHDPLLGTEPAPTLDRNLIIDLLSELDPDDYVASGEGIEITALEMGEPPIGALPLAFSRMELNALVVDTGDTFTPDTRTDFEWTVACDDGDSSCVWPVGWDLMPDTINLYWKSLVLTQEELEAIVQEDGYRLTLWVNGTRLRMGPLFAVPPSPVGDFAASTLPDHRCQVGRRCILTLVRSGARLRDVPLPWRFELEVEKIVELNPPIAIIDPESGEVTSYAIGAEHFASAFLTITPNATTGRSFFEEAINPTFKSDRCMDCHGFGTISAIAAHHDYTGGEYTSADDFVRHTQLELEPSAYVEGAHVMTCASCHHVPLTDSHGHAFEETVWKAPYFDLDVDWSTKTAGQICRRVRTSLPNEAIRQQHFHEDGRLYWAIEAPYILGQYLPPAAAPQDFDEFLRRVDAWSYWGVPCP